MDKDTLKAYAAAIEAATNNQQVLNLTYINAEGRTSERLVVPCSPMAVNPDGTANFNVYSEEQTDNGPRVGIVTLRLDRIQSLGLADLALPENFWNEVMRASGTETVLFPTTAAELAEGKFPPPRKASVLAGKLQANGWADKPSSGFVQKTRGTNRVRTLLRQ